MQPSASAASFDCKKASTESELAICANPDLSQFDKKMAEMYSLARNVTSDVDDLRKHQRKWLKIRNECGGSKTCLIKIYKDRIKYLKLTATIDSVEDLLDCNKSISKTEEMICSSKELLELHARVAELFPQVLQVVLDENEYKRGSQYFWLTKLNKCEAAECLIDSYQKRISHFNKMLTVKFSEDKAKYPPYPNVWDRSIPKIMGRSRSSADIYELLNGDIILFYLKENNYFSGFRSVAYGAFYFFDGKEIDDADRTSGSYKLKSLEQHGSGLVFMLKGGVKVSYQRWDPRGPSRCPQALNHYFLFEYPDGLVEKKSFVYLLDEAVETSVRSGCIDTNEKTYQKQVVTLKSQIIALEDGGFLLVDESEVSIAIRFDKNIETQSKLLGKKLFIIDADELKKRFDSPLSDGNQNYQKSQDNVLTYIKSLSK